MALACAPSQQAVAAVESTSVKRIKAGLHWPWGIMRLFLHCRPLPNEQSHLPATCRQSLRGDRGTEGRPATSMLLTMARTDRKATILNAATMPVNCQEWKVSIKLPTQYIIRRGGCQGGEFLDKSDLLVYDRPGPQRRRHGKGIESILPWQCHGLNAKGGHRVYFFSPRTKCRTSGTLHHP